MLHVAYPILPPTLLPFSTLPSISHFLDKYLLALSKLPLDKSFLISVDEIIDQKVLKLVTDTAAIEELVTQVIDENPDQVIQLREGKEQVLGYLVGQAMKLSQGKANPSQVNQLLKLKIQ